MTTGGLLGEEPLHQAPAENSSLVREATCSSWSATAEEQREYLALESNFNRLARFCVRSQNFLLDLTHRRRRLESDSPEWNEILCRARQRSDVSDHLPILFTECLSRWPRLIVELGCREGETTFVFERVCRLTGGKCVSVDIEHRTRPDSNQQWLFIQSDDIEFAKRFPAWCGQNGFSPEIDILFVDTTHFFAHTMQEIEHWFPLLGPSAKAIFHDTNQKRIYHRKDGSLGVGWNNRGVIAALERFFQKNFNEKQHFVDFVDGWLIRHHPNCNGLTILTRMVEAKTSFRLPPR